MEKKLLTLFFLFLTGTLFLDAQVIFQEDFEGGSLPAGWSISTNATDGGWNVGTAASLSSQSFNIQDNGSTRIIGSNDDDCNCDKSADFLNTPRLDFSGLTSAVLRADVFYTGDSYQGVSESAEIAISTDSVNWTTLAELEGNTEWTPVTLILDDWAGMDSVYLSFRYNDNGGWLYGIGLDNIVIEVPPTLDAAFTSLNDRRFGETEIPFPFKGKISNNGRDTIKSLEISYSINGGTPVATVMDNLSIPSFAEYDFNLTDGWIPSQIGMTDVVMEITAVNNEIDEDSTNNIQNLNTEIFEQVIVPNKIDEYIGKIPFMNEVATSADQLDKPADLDFFPIKGLDEVWVVNQRTENSGGSTLTITGASTEDPDYWHRVDGNSWHFMSIPTAIEFDPVSFFFATTPGVQDANHSGGTFTGPTLWESHPDIYAQPSGGNGSHMDMLHGSPYSMGIAHEVDNVYWVYDDWNKDIVRYDFVEDHGPGNSYHGDAMVLRYQNIGINADGDVPSHMILHKESGWLYIVDNGNDRVIRLDINSGVMGNSIPLINEPLAQHAAVVNFNWETIIDQGLDRPSGIEIMENRLLVSDYATGEIIVYDMDADFEEIGRIPTETPGITGIKVGPTGDIWYTNRIMNTLIRAEPGDVSNDEEQVLAEMINVSPNPTSGKLNIKLPEFPGNPMVEVSVKNINGNLIRSFPQAGTNIQIDLGDLPNGVYLLSITADQLNETRKVVVSK